MTTSEARKPAQSAGLHQRNLDDEQNSRSRLLKFVCFTMVLVAATLIFTEMIARFVLFVSKPTLSGNPQYDLKYLVAKTVTPNEDNIVLCGDSMVKQGLYPELIAAKLQKTNDHIRVVNLGVDKGSQQDAIDYLQFLKNMRCTKPRLVVFDFEVSSTCGGNDAQTAPAPKKKDDGAKSSYLFKRKFANKLSLADTVMYAPDDVSMIIRFRGALKRMLTQFIGAIPNLGLYDILSTVQLCNSNDSSTSYCGMSPTHDLTLLKTYEEQTHSAAGNWKAGPQSGNFIYNEHSYDKLIKFCQSEEIPLMLVWLPHQRSIYTQHWYQAPYTEQWFRSKFEEHSKQLFVFPECINNLPDDPSYYSDYRHLSTYGCIKASELLADAINKPKYRSLIEHRGH